jgi:hypothetical protein
MHQGATPFFERPVTTGDPEAFVHGVRPSSVSNLSPQPPRFAMRSLVCPSQPRLLSWGDVVRSMVLEGTVWRPHSLHTAEVVGSNPTTPTLLGGLINEAGASLGSAMCRVWTAGAWRGRRPGGVSPSESTCVTGLPPLVDPRTLATSPNITCSL